MKAKRILSLLLAVLMLAIPLASCGGGDETTTTTTTTTAPTVTTYPTLPTPDPVPAAQSLAQKLINEGFVFVGAEKATDKVNTATAAAINVCKAIDKWGVSVNDDFFPREEGVKEIIMGKIRRSEATTAYDALYANRLNAANDWRITVDANTVLIIAGSDDGLVLALNYFTAMLQADANAFFPSYDSGIQHYNWPVSNLGGKPVKDYKIVVAQGADEAMQTAAKTLQDKVFAASGHTLPIVDDATAQGAAELILGQTSRAISASAMAALRAGRKNCAYDGVVFGQNGQIVVSGGGLDAINLAISHFATDYLVEANAAQLSGLSKLYQKDGIKSLSFAGNDAGDYRVVYAADAPFDLRYVAYYLDKLLYEQFGYKLEFVTDATPAVAGQKEILLGKTNRPTSTTLAIDAYNAKVDANGNVVFDAGHYVGVQKMYQTMLAELSAQTGSALTAAVNYSGTVTDIALTWAPDMEKQMTDLRGNKLNNATFLSNFDVSDEYKLVWNDEFDGTALDYEKWSGATPMVMSDLHQHMESPYVNVRDGNLVLYANYTRTGSGRYDVTFDTAYSIVTNDTMNYSGGYIEMRARVPFSEGGKGEWSSYWAQSSTSYLFKEAYRREHNDELIDNGYFVEVDMFEQFSKNDQGWSLYCVCSNLHKWFNAGYTTTESGETSVRNSTMAAAPQEGQGPARYKFNSHTEGNEYHTYGFLWTDEFMAFDVDGQFYYSFSMVEDGHDWVNRLWNTKTQQWEDVGMGGYQKENMALNIIIGHMFFTPKGALADGWYSDDYKEGATTWEGNQTGDWCEINWGREDECFPSYYIVDYMRVYQCAKDYIYTPDTIGLGTAHVDSNRWDYANNGVKK